MKKLFVLFLVISLKANAQYDHQNITLYSNWHDSTVVAEPVYGIKYSSCYGWANGGHEYAVIGSSAGTYFIEVTNPAAPVVRDYVGGRRDSCIWREYKTYQHYLYMVSDDAAPNSLQIADMSYLPDSVHVVYDSTDVFVRSHTIFIDGDKLYGGSVTTTGNYSAMSVFSLANPEHPVLLRKLGQDYPGINLVHDMLVRNDTIYASCGNSGLYVFTYNSASNVFTMIGSLTSYNFMGYNHSSALTQDGKTLVFTDEVPVGLPVKACDISDLSDIQVKSDFFSHTGATPHNPYMVGKKVVIAYYEDGVYIYDISDPAHPSLSGYFDTHPQNGTTYNGYAGCWGAYTELPSKHLIASDMQNGLFVLNADSLLSSVHSEALARKNISLQFKTISTEKLELQLLLDENERFSFSILDLQGKILLSGEQEGMTGKNIIPVNTSALAEGMYVVILRGRNFSVADKWVKM